MLKKVALFTGRVTTKAIRTVEDIALDALMWRIHKVLRMFMTRYARENLPVAGVGMAGRAFVPCVEMRA